MPIILPFPGYEPLAEAINRTLQATIGTLTVRHFPDGESFVQLHDDVMGKEVIILCGLEHPDEKIMALMFCAEVARKSGARTIGLVAPYLGYMRQDKMFHTGEAVTSEIFAAFLSTHIDWLVTLDPHLHRHKSLDDIYTIPSVVLHAADPIADWIRTHVERPVLIGPDEESEQWVADVANRARASFTVLTKIRKGDKEVEVSVPDVDRYQAYTPILVDDIISTARTMIETVKHLHEAGMKPPLCIGIHAVFAGDAYAALEASGVAQIVTCNTIPHISNGIDVSALFAEAVKSFVSR
jgi:ribose-phosphate pyrophosphokinase